MLTNRVKILVHNFFPDIEKPVITACVAYQETQTDAGKPTASVVYQPPTAIDNSGEVTITCNPPTKSEFDMGQTTVTCIARDSSGNNDTCEFVVHVKGEPVSQLTKEKG